MTSPTRDITHHADAPAEEPQLTGLHVINRATGQIEAFITLTKNEQDMPGYVERVQHSYEGTRWYAERIHGPAWWIAQTALESGRPADTAHPAAPAGKPNPASASAADPNATDDADR